MKRILGFAASTTARRFILDSPSFSCQGQITNQNFIARRPANNSTAFFITTRTMADNPGRNLDLTYDDVIRLKGNNEITLIDVRENSEIQETGKLPDSIHIPLGELPEALQSSAESFKSKYGATQPAKDAQIVFSCKGGVRSRRAMTSALELGFKNSRHYIGGFMDWQEKTK